jgi:hypothetical protein
MRHWADDFSLCCRRLNSIRSSIFFRPWVGRLSAFFVLAIALSLFLADDRAIAEILLQSPPSPPAQPVPPEQPPAQPAPTEPAPAQPQPTAPAPAPQAPTAPVVPTPTFASPLAPAGESPVATVLSTSTEPPTFVQPTPLPRSRSRDDAAAVEEEAASNLILDQVEFIDTLVVSGAYVWLCCGIALLLLLPLIFLLLQIRGQIKIQREEDL